MTIRADTLPITFEIDDQAEQGDLIGALAALLIEVDTAQTAEEPQP